MHLITIALGKEAEEGMSDVSSGGMVRQVLKLELLLTLVEGSGWLVRAPSVPAKRQIRNGHSRRGEGRVVRPDRRGLGGGVLRFL